MFRRTGSRSDQLTGRSIGLAHPLEYLSHFLSTLLQGVDSRCGQRVALVSRIQRLVTNAASLTVGQNAARHIWGQARVVVQNCRARFDNLIDQLLRLRRALSTHGGTVASIKLLKQAVHISFRCVDPLTARENGDCHTRT